MLINLIYKRTYLTKPLGITLAKRWYPKPTVPIVKEVVEKGAECIGKACNEGMESVITAADSVINTPNTTPTAQPSPGNLPNTPRHLPMNKSDYHTPQQTTGSTPEPKVPTVAQAKDIPSVLNNQDVQRVLQNASPDSNNLSVLDKTKQAMKDGSWFTIEGQDSSKESDSKSPSVDNNHPAENSSSSDTLSLTPSMNSVPLSVDASSHIPTPPPMPQISAYDKTYPTVPITKEVLQQAKSNLKSTDSVTNTSQNSSNNTVQIPFRIHTPLLTPFEEIGSTPTSVEDHTPEVDRLLQEATDKKIIKYADAPDNSLKGASRPSTEGHTLYNKLYPKEKELSKNPLSTTEMPLKIGNVRISDETLIPRSDQQHPNVLYIEKDDKIYIVGYFTSNNNSTVKIADQQPSGAKKSNSDEDKPQQMVVFNQPRQVAANDIEIDDYWSAYIQYETFSSKIKAAIETTLQYEPISYDPNGFTEEDLQAIIALQEIEQADDAIKKEKKMSHLTKDQRKKIEEKEMKKVLKAKENQEKQKKESQDKKAKDKWNYKQKDLNNDE